MKNLLFSGRTVPFIRNGIFESDPNVEWTAVDCTLASMIMGVAGNCLWITTTGGLFQNATQIISDELTLGQRYIFRCWVQSGTSGDEAARLVLCDLTLTEGTITHLVSAAGWAEYTAIFTPLLFTRFFVQMQKDTATAGTMHFDEAQFLEY